MEYVIATATVTAGSVKESKLLLLNHGEYVTATAAVTASSWAVKESELLLLNHGKYVTAAG